MGKRHQKITYYLQTKGITPPHYGKICGNGAYRMVDGRPVFIYYLNNNTYIATMDIVVQLHGIYEHDEVQMTIFDKTPCIISGANLWKLHTTIEVVALKSVFKGFKKKHPESSKYAVNTIGFKNVFIQFTEE